MPIGILSLSIYLADCQSLKDKRARIKPVLHRLHREFNVSTAELEYNDVWKNALIGVACLGNESVHVRQVLQSVLEFTETNWPDIEIIQFDIEIL